MTLNDYINIQKLINEKLFSLKIELENLEEYFSKEFKLNVKGGILKHYTKRDIERILGEEKFKMFMNLNDSVRYYEKLEYNFLFQNLK